MSQINTDKIASNSGGTTALTIADNGGVTAGGVITGNGSGITSLSNSNITANPFMFYGRQASNQTIPRASTTVISGMTTNEIDPSSAFDGTTFTVPSGGAGVYLVQAHLTIYFNDGSDGETAQLYLFANGEKCTSRFQNASTKDTVYCPLTCATMVTLAVGNTIYMSTYSVDNNGGTSVTFNAATSLSAYRISV